MTGTCSYMLIHFLPFPPYTHAKKTTAASFVIFFLNFFLPSCPTHPSSFSSVLLLISISLICGWRKEGNKLSSSLFCGPTFSFEEEEEERQLLLLFLLLLLLFLLLLHRWQTDARDCLEMQLTPPPPPLHLSLHPGRILFAKPSVPEKRFGVTLLAKVEDMVTFFCHKRYNSIAWTIFFVIVRFTNVA